MVKEMFPLVVETVSLTMEIISIVMEKVSLVMENISMVVEIFSLVMEMAGIPIFSRHRLKIFDRRNRQNTLQTKEFAFPDDADFRRSR